MDRASQIYYGLWDRLLVNVSRCCRPGVPQQALCRLNMSFALAKGGDGAANDLEGQIRQVQCRRKLFEDTPAEIASINETTVLIRKNEGFRRRIRTLRLPIFQVRYWRARNLRSVASRLAAGRTLFC